MTFDLPAELLERARRAVNTRTKRETVIAGLKELIRKARREELRSLAGRLRLNITRSREHRRF